MYCIVIVWAPKGVTLFFSYSLPRPTSSGLENDRKTTRIRLPGRGRWWALMRWGSMRWGGAVGGQSSRALAGKARKCGRLSVFACVPNPDKQSMSHAACGDSVVKVLGNKARKKCQIVPFLPMCWGGCSWETMPLSNAKQTPEKSTEWRVHGSPAVSGDTPRLPHLAAPPCSLPQEANTWHRAKTSHERLA